ncbi:putative B12-binding domain-containing radical SAM protein [Candidatus Termititenax dinenymphae]|uniref:B12-binding domain-containing radical SAM protein n=1 Tax=Candidatus Termititenax dinenymphae TaxID=2218523 RepID=A0A388TLV6_9BACT|nr:putative B12-binding domain-containing radical SAM protein [Candidatus Termititenax dinenymphae]
MLSRSGREAGAILLAAYQLGCRYDAWQEHFKYEFWLNALAQCGKTLADFLQPLPTNKELPWDNIDTLVPKSYLLKEYEKALQ